MVLSDGKTYCFTNPLIVSEEKKKRFHCLLMKTVLLLTLKVWVCVYPRSVTGSVCSFYFWEWHQSCHSTLTCFRQKELCIKSHDLCSTVNHIKTAPTTCYM